MSGTYGIAGFVEGFMGGVDKRYEWKDRKRNQERQDKLDAMDADMQERRLKLLDQQIASNDLSMEESRRAAAEAAEMRGVFSGAVDATNASMGAADSAAPGAVAVPATPGATSGLPPPMGILPMGIPEGPESRPKVAPPLMPSAAELREKAAQSGQTPGVVNAPVVGPAGGPVPGSGSAPSATPSTPYMPPRGLPGVFPDGPPAPPVTGAYPAAAARPVDNSAADFVAAKAGGDPVADFIAMPKKAEAEAAAEKRAAQDMELERNRRVRDEDGPIPLAWRKEADDAIGKMTRERAAATPPVAITGAAVPPTRENAAALKADPKTALSDAWQNATKPPRIDPMKGKAPASARPIVRGLADTAAEAMAATTSPAMEATAAAASKGLPDTAGKKAPTEATRNKYAGDFMDHYREVGAPMVYEALISKGEFAKADAFRQFLDSDATKAGMENWARAAFAASVGDMDTFADEIMEAYDRLDYFPDGTTIVREESGFTKDKAGNITGAKLTFKDEKTGNTFDQVFTDPNDLVRMGITLLAPEQAFEYYFEQQQAAAETARGVQKDQSEADKDQQKRVDDVAKMIFENSKDISGIPQISYGEAVKQAQEQISGADAASPAAAGVPVARRPG